MRLAVRGIEKRDVDALLRFSARMYGENAYQASRRYVDWLYLENPRARGLQDCLVALDREAIVGCIHRMRLPCLCPRGETTIASLQNHVVAPELRGGAGIMLLQKAVKSEDFAFSPGVAGRLRDAYRRLGYDETPSFWLKRWLNPVQALWQAGARKVSHGRWPKASLRVASLLSRRAGDVGLSVTHEPDTEQLQRLADAMTKQMREQSDTYVPWDPAQVRWRYFSGTGPRHVLIEKPASSAWAVLSFGVRESVNVTRLLEHDAADDQLFLGEILAVARGLGAALALSYTVRAQDRDRLLGSGWRVRTDAPSSFRKGDGAIALSAGATDVGFESLLTEVTL